MVVTLALLLLYEAHDSALVVGSVAVVVLSLGQPLVRRDTAWRAAPLVGGCVAGVEQAYAMRHLGSNLRALPRIIDLATWQKIEQVPKATPGLHGSTTTRPAFFVVSAVVFVLAAQRDLQQHRRRGRSELGSTLTDSRCSGCCSSSSTSRFPSASQEQCGCTRAS